MPGPWRPQLARDGDQLPHGFHLNTSSRPLRTQAATRHSSNIALFQSQPRCQAPGDSYFSASIFRILRVSISTEMPGPWRPLVADVQANGLLGFNLNRDARPL